MVERSGGLAVPDIDDSQSNISPTQQAASAELGFLHNPTNKLKTAPLELAAGK